MALTKNYLIEKVHDRLSAQTNLSEHLDAKEKDGLTRNECANAVEILLEEIKCALEKNEEVKITGFGSFEVCRKEPRRGRNPQTGEGTGVRSYSLTG